MTKKVVVRYAPSPTGPQHIGGVRTALYCYLFAKQQNGEFILRIEDTDQTRFVEGAEAYIIEAMEWLKMDFTQGVHLGGSHAPYRQSERSRIYQKYANQLIAEDKAYIAFDTSEEIEAMRDKMRASGAKSPQYNYITRMAMKNSLTLPKEEVDRRLRNGDPYVVRLKVPRKEEIRFHDEIRGWVVIHSSHIDDKVLLKSDGLPTYHLANVIDDHLMEVSHVIRGEEWLPSTPLHVLLYRAFGWEDTMPKFAHLPLLVNPDNSKMSKRNADKFGIPVFPLNWLDKASGEIWKGYREMGYLPDAFFNYLALMGWNPGDNREIMSRQELIDAFSLERVGKSAIKFDLEKLRHFNETYLRALSREELLPLVQKAFEDSGINHPNEEKLLQIIPLLKERVSFIHQFAEYGRYFFEAPQQYDAKQVKKRWDNTAIQNLKTLTQRFEAIESWEEEAIEKAFKTLLSELNIGMGKLMMPLRLALTGMGFGPGIFAIASLIGKTETLSRIEKAIREIGEQQ